MLRGDWIDRTAGVLLRLSLAVVFLWFALLKLFDLCPLSGFIARSVPFLPAGTFLVVLGCWEAAIGICLLVPSLVRWGLALLFLHLPGTVLPFFVIPSECFLRFPFALTLEGQYVVKNLVLASAALAVAARYRPVVVRRARPGKTLVPTAFPVRRVVRPAPQRPSRNFANQRTPVAASRKM
jgi:uncharacterized membrane protein YkgB